MSALIKVLLLGHPDPDVVGDTLRLEGRPPHEADDFDTLARPDDRGIAQLLAQHHPHVILTFGAGNGWNELGALSIDYRRRWVHFDTPPSGTELANLACNVYIDVATRARFPDLPLVSVFTPTYRTGERLNRPLQSLLAQTYTNWEWVVYDDSPDDATFEQLKLAATLDPRIRVFRGDRNCGVIGEVKRRLCGLARGSILVELDHDDELTDHCLADVVQAFRVFPDAGFVYTDCAELFEDGQAAGYGDSYAFDFGTYRREAYRGRDLLVTNYPSVNAKTIRHIVGVPNHVRSWRREAYERTGGHGSEIHVCDDYELLIRTFLTTRMVHVQRLGYLQYLQRDGGNTQRVRNKEIQRLVRLFHERYEGQIHERFVELGIEDFIWRNGALDWSIPNPSPAPIANYVLR